MEDAIEGASGAFDTLSQQLPQIVAAILLLVGMVVAGRVLGGLAARTLARRRRAQIHGRFVRNLIAWSFLFVGALLAMAALGLDRALTGLLAGSGVAAVVFGFAFREIGENLLAGIFLAFSRPFDVGDLILSDTLEGEVRRIELRYTHIRTVDGRDIYIPNAQIFNKPLINYTRDGLRRPCFTLGIDYGDDAEKARLLLLDAVRAVSGVLADPPAGVWLLALRPSYVELEVSFWINTFSQGGDRAASRLDEELGLAAIRSRVIEACRRTLLENGFTVSANVATAVALQGPDPAAER